MQNKRILVVDDEEALRRSILRHLKKTEALCFEAGNGEEALATLGETKPVLILLDIMMPVMDGLEFCRQVRRVPEMREVYLIFLTSKSDLKDRVLGLYLGADNYLTKPFEPKALLEAVEVGLAAKAQTRQAILDPLTELYNRHYFNLRLGDEQYRAQLYHRGLSLALIDLNGFGMADPEVGKLGWDTILSTLAHLMKSQFRRCDLLAYLGEGNLAVLLPESEPYGAKQILEEFVALVKASDFPKKGKIILRIGLASGEPGHLLKQAEEALRGALIRGEWLHVLPEP